MEKKHFVLKKNRNEELWFKSLKLGKNNEITEYCWTPYYEGVDIFESAETIIAVTNHLNITYIIEEYED